MNSKPNESSSSNGGADPFSSRLLRLLPSLTELIFVLLLLAFTVGTIAPRLLWDADIGWHIRNGQDILSSHRIPQVDSFSATMSGRPWFAWEWLYDTLIGWTFNHTGLNGVVFFSALVIAATLALVFRFTLRRGGNLLVTVVLFVLCVLASSIHFLARPHVVGWLLAVLWFWVLDRCSTGNVKLQSLIWLPLLMLLWANLHGGFVLGFVLVAIYFVSDLLQWLRCREEEVRSAAGQRAGMLALAGLISFVASLFNPYGIRLHSHVYRYLTDRFLMEHINEFQRPDLHQAPAQAFLLMSALAVAGVIAVRGRMRWTSGLLIIFSIVSGLYAARNLPFASMLLMMTTGPLLSGRMEGKRLFAALQRYRTRELRSRLPLWGVLTILVCGLICVRGGNLLGKQVMNAHFDPLRLPVKEIDQVQAVGLRQPIFSLDSWGGYLIFRLYPGNKVFVDDRHDFYGDEYIREYLKVIRVEAGWEEVLKEWQVNQILMPASSKLSSALSQSRDWERVSVDETAARFERRLTAR